MTCDRNERASTTHCANASCSTTVQRAEYYDNKAYCNIACYRSTLVSCYNCEARVVASVCYALYEGAAFDSTSMLHFCPLCVDEINLSRAQYQPTGSVTVDSWTVHAADIAGIFHVRFRDTANNTVWGASMVLPNDARLNSVSNELNNNTSLMQELVRYIDPLINHECVLTWQFAGQEQCTRFIRCGML